MAIDQIYQPGDRKREEQADHKNTMTIISFDESNGWNGPFRIILSVLTVLLQVQHARSYILEYILHITNSADQAQKSTNP